ncbi:MAG: glucose-6-phosphate isomerase [Alphaproteobacteria bacterium]|nr:glucose-6-phosphate isomerase [Alphaproteobacteria bacterium]
MTLTSSPAWQALLRHRDSLRQTRVAFDDVARLKTFDIAFDGLRLNYAFQNVSAETLPLLVALAAQQQVPDWRARMFKGDKINATENRAALHTALRRLDDAPVFLDAIDVMPEVRAAQNRISAFVDDVRTGKWTGATGKPFRAIVNIGIGGSDLGPRLAAKALQPYASGFETHFVANADAFDIADVLRKVDPAQTLFVVVSKTFTTQETLLNAHSARRWLVEKLGEGAVERHFVAVSVNRDAVEAFGIHAENMFPMWDWVGGRYSLWSAVGLSVGLAIGNDNFRALLAGAASMDAHFQTAPLVSNMPVVLALLGIWNRNFLGASALAILPYCERLRDLPRYLQQLEMESNGKSVTRGGEATGYATAPVLFGDCGTISQHSFHQCLHQGTDIIPADFIGVATDDLNQPDHHRALLSNMAAQMGALALGRKQAAKPQDVYAGGRPSNLILLDKLDPYRLGMLLALYEHKTFVQSVIWDINAFDQPGVELGKQMAKSLENSHSTDGAGDIMGQFFRMIFP